MSTVTERQRARRARLREAGEVEVSVVVPTHQVEALREIAADWCARHQEARAAGGAQARPGAEPDEKCN